MSKPMSPKPTSELIHNASETTVKRTIILDEDLIGGEMLRRLLNVLGYESFVMTGMSAALDVLRASAEPLAVFFDVEAYGETLDGASYTCLIGALLNEPALAQRHIYSVISSSADDVEAALGKTLAHLNIPVLSKPCDAQTIAGLLARAQPSMAPQPTPLYGLN